MMGKGEIVLDVNESITVISGGLRIVVTREESIETHKKTVTIETYQTGDNGEVNLVDDKVLYE